MPDLTHALLVCDRCGRSMRYRAAIRCDDDGVDIQIDRDAPALHRGSCRGRRKPDGRSRRVRPYEPLRPDAMAHGAT